MRPAIFALMMTLWFTTSPALARNGETGILVKVQTFEFLENEEHEITTLVLCSEDMARISQLLAEGYDISLDLPGYGVFELEATPSGDVSLYQKDIDIITRECQALPDTRAC